MKLTEEQNKELKKALSSYLKNEKMVEYRFKNNKYIVINGMFINIGNAKPEIENILYYNDERESIENSLNTFINYNMRKLSDEYTLTRAGYYGVEYLYFVPIYHECENLNLYTLEYRDEGTTHYKRVTRENLILINQAKHEIKTDYLKRLKTYYNKYANNIQSQGYWANR